MRKHWLLFSFTAVFLITAPVVVMYSAGYRINWQSRQIQKTGLLFVRSAPKDANIFINDRKRNEKTPARLQSLLPGDYQVTVSKDGLQPWSKKLRIREGTTTFADTIMLFHAAPVLEKVQDVRAESAFPSPDARQAAIVSKDGSRTSLWILDLSIGTFSQLLSLDAGEDVEQLVWSPAGDSLCILLRDGRGLLFVPVAPSPNVTRLPDLPGRISQLQWSQDGTALYVGNEQGLFTYRIANQTFEQLIASPVRAFQFIGSDAYVLVPTSSGTQLELRRQPYSQAVATATVDFSADADFTPTTQPYVQILDRGQDLLYIFNDGLQELQSFPHTTYQQWSAGAGLFTLNAKAALLFGDAYEIGLYSFDTFVNAYRRATLARYPTPMGFVVWHPTYKAVLFVREQNLYAAETDDRSGAQVFPLAELGADPLLVLPSPDGENIYVVFSESSARPGVFRTAIFDRDAFLR